MFTLLWHEADREEGPLASMVRGNCRSLQPPAHSPFSTSPPRLPVRALLEDGSYKRARSWDIATVASYVPSCRTLCCVGSSNCFLLAAQARVPCPNFVCSLPCKQCCHKPLCFGTAAELGKRDCRTPSPMNVTRLRFTTWAMTPSRLDTRCCEQLPCSGIATDCKVLLEYLSNILFGTFGPPLLAKSYGVVESAHCNGKPLPTVVFEICFKF